VQGEDAAQLLSRFSQLATHDCYDSAVLDQLKAFLRLLIRDERRQLSTSGWPAENPSQVSAVAAAAARRVDLRRYKTELCRSYAETGQCRYGVKCQFAHGADELRPLARHPRYRTELCHSFHVNGFCPYGSRCNFIHSDATVTEATAGNKPTAMPSGPQTAEVSILLQRSAGSCQASKQFLKQSNDDVKQRAICGRQAPAEMSPLALLHALGSSQATGHMKLMHHRHFIA